MWILAQTLFLKNKNKNEPTGWLISYRFSSLSPRRTVTLCMVLGIGMGLCNKMPSSYESLFELAENRMLSALSAYHIWKWLNIAINVHHPNGKGRVDRNLKIINTYKAVFPQIVLSSYKSFVVDLFIFFDSGKYESFSLRKLIASMENKLTPDELVSLKNEIESTKKDHGMTIGFIEELRNADVAHQKIDAKSRRVLYEKIEGLFGGVQKILNLVSHRYDRSVTRWDHVPREVDHQMKWLFDNLERGEKVRLEQIEKK